MVPKYSLRDLDLETHLRDPTIKQRYVTTLFDLISRRYDRFTRVFSCGMDQRWKHELVSWLVSSVPSAGKVLDLASGTGDLALAAGALMPDGQVVGIDASRMMSMLARTRLSKEKHRCVDLSVGDIMKLPMRDGCANAVMIGYGLRNVPDYGAALEEIARVLRPGGRLLTLDFYRPRNRVWRRLFLSYLRITGNLIGWLWHSEPAAYGYIARSIEHFVSFQDFAGALQAHGFVVEVVRPKLWGGICLHVARKASGVRPQASAVL